jgi:deazaflavin-dependent oxidoreductase (nitroreductase family)
MNANPAIHSTTLGPRTRRAVRFAARLINPAVLLIAGRRWNPIVGILHHRGRLSGRAYATPLGMRPLGDSFIMPRTFGDDAAWYRNVLAAGGCIVTYRGTDYTLVDPEVIDYETAAPAFPRYERLQFRLVGINQYLRLRLAHPTPTALGGKQNDNTTP